ncbi:MAG: 4-hydroxyphenylacetate 3-hydroxylase, partial [Rhizobiales bacterium]|nr:4-hydroxyphenylacetate 3-hydroxylase [Hyphomicrobiales bacterium]
MIRTGEEYRASLRDGRQVWMSGERVKDVTAHPMFKPLIDIRARIYDMQHDAATASKMTYEEDGEKFAIGLKLPFDQKDWADKRQAVDLVCNDIGGIVTRVGDETIGEMWSLWDGADILNEIDERFAANIERHIHSAIKNDPFHVSANTDPKGDRSKRPQDQDPDMLVHVVRETDEGIIIRGAKYETAAAYSNQAFLKPTIANWGDAKLSDYALGCIVRMNAPGVKQICRTGFA